MKMYRMILSISLSLFLCQVSLADDLILKGSTNIEGELSVGGNAVISSSGQWVGDPTGLRGPPGESCDSSDLCRLFILTGHAPPSYCTVKIVFASSALYDGNLGGLDGADRKCQELAQAAGLYGVYKAWLSDGIDSPDARFTQEGMPYVLVDGTVVAEDWSDLIDGELNCRIYLTEYGQNIEEKTKIVFPFRRVWTNTKSDGTIYSNQDKENCCNFLSNDSSDMGMVGFSSWQTYLWTIYTSIDCDTPLGLYCFQQ